MAFDPATCESETSTSVLVVFGLDTSDLRIERLDVIRETGRFSTPAEAVASLSFTGPSNPLTRVFARGDLELWEAPANDFGAVAWIDARSSEVAFSGAVIWSSGGGAQGVEDPAILVGASPSPLPEFALAPSRYWSEDGSDVDRTARLVVELGVRSEAYARYASCGQAQVTGYIYTPSVGVLNPSAARGLVFVSGHRAAGPRVR